MRALESTGGLVTLVFVMATVSACAASAPDTGDLELTAHASSAVCTSAALSDQTRSYRDRTCESVWAYQQYSVPCMVNKQDPRCGIAGYQQTQCTAYTTCASPSFGVAYRTTQSSTTSVVGDAVKQRKCEVSDGRRVCYDEIVGYNYGRACLEAANARRDAVRASYPTEAANIGVTQLAAPRSMNRYGACSITVTGIPVWNQRAQAPCPTYNYSCNDPSRPIYATCPVTNSTPNECPAGTATVLSPAQKSLTEAEATDPNMISPADPLAPGAPTCLSCEPLPATTSSEVLAKYACLDRNFTTASALPPGEVRDGALTKIAANMKLLAELKGSLLPQSAIDRIVQVYATMPDARATCADPMPALPEPDAACGDVAALSSLNGRLRFCQGLAADNGEPASDIDRDWDLWSSCMQTADTIASIPATDCHREAYEAAFDGMSRALFKQRWAFPLPSVGDDTFEGEAQKRLRYLGTWNTAAARIYRDRAPAKLLDRVSEHVGAFWGVVQARAFEKVPALNDDGSPRPVNEAVLDEVTTNALTGDRKVLSALYRPDPKLPVTAPDVNAVPAKDEVLLTVTADVLESLRARLADANLVHDLACLVGSCKQPAFATSLSAAWRAEASIFSTTQLSALATTPLDDDWKAVMANILVNHAHLENAVARATGTPFDAAALSSARVDALPAVVRPLVRLAQTATSYTNGFARQQLFDPSVVSSVGGSLGDARQQELFGLIAAARLELTGAVNQYKDNRARLVEEIVTSLRQDNAQSQVSTALALKNEQASEIIERLGGLRRSASLDSVKFGDFMKSFEATVAADKLGESAKVVTSTVSLGVVPSDAHYTAGGPRALPALAVQQGGTPLRIAAEAGEVINVTAAGSWAPTCALRRSPQFGPRLVANNPMIGPEGFLLSIVDGKYQTVSQQDTKGNSASSSASVQASLCAGVKATSGTPGQALFGSGVEAYVDASVCVRAELGTTTQTSSTQIDNQSTESRQAATFLSGVRLDDTPLPNYPAGALLLVGVARGQTDVGSIRINRPITSPTTSVIADQPLDFYLIVNDLAECGAGPEQGGLTVTATKLTPSGIAAKQLGVAMGSTLTSLRQQATSIAAQSGVLPSQPALLRSNAQTSLRAACGYCDLASFPPSLLELFNNFVDAELVRLERTAALRDAELALRHITMEADQVTSDLVVNGKVSRLQRLLPAWRARDIDAERIQSPMRLLVDLVARNLYPLASARYPTELEAAAADLSTRNAATKVLGHKWSDSAVDIAGDLDLLVSALVSRYQAATGSTPSSTTRIAISYPNPNPLYPAPPSPFYEVDAVRSGAVWDALLNNQAAFLTVRPEDLYADQGVGRVPCNVRAPVLSGMALYVAGVDDTVASTLNSLAYNSSIYAGTDMTVPNDGGLRLYEQRNKQTLNGLIATKFGPASAALANVAADVKALPGMSPFGSFRINPKLVGTFGDPLTEATAIVLVMELSTRTSPTSSGTLPGVLTCPQN